MIPVSLTEIFERTVEERLAEDGVVCPRCDGEELDVDVWDVSDDGPGEPRAAAACEACGARLNVRVTAEDVEEARRIADE